MRKTVRLVRRISNAVRALLGQAPADPDQAPELGRWTLQVDQQRKYSRAPDGVDVRADIDVAAGVQQRR